MLPYLQIGPWEVSTYRLLYAIAIFAGGVYAYRRLPQAAHKASLRYGILVAIFGLFLGLILPSLFTNAILWLKGLPPVPTTTGRVYYAVALGLAAAAIYARIVGGPLLIHIDRALPALALGYAIGRLGCLAAGCCGGIETEAALGVYLPDSHGHWHARYPTQIMSGLFQLLVLAGLLALERWPSRPAWLCKPGVLTTAYLLLFCLERFGLDFLREDHYPVWGALGQPQLVTLAGAAAAAAALAWFAARRPRTARPA